MDFFTRPNINGGTVTTDSPPIAIIQTWNNSGITFNTIKVSITDTASLAGNFLDFLKGGVSKFSVDKNGAVQMVSFNASSFASVAGSPVVTQGTILPIANQTAINLGGGNVNIGLDPGAIAAVGLQLFQSCV